MSHKKGVFQHLANIVLVLTIGFVIAGIIFGPGQLMSKASTLSHYVANWFLPQDASWDQAPRTVIGREDVGDAYTYLFMTLATAKLRENDKSCIISYKYSETLNDGMPKNMNDWKIEITSSPAGSQMAVTDDTGIKKLRPVYIPNVRICTVEGEEEVQRFYTYYLDGVGSPVRGALPDYRDLSTSGDVLTLKEAGFMSSDPEITINDNSHELEDQGWLYLAEEKKESGETFTYMCFIPTKDAPVNIGLFNDKCSTKGLDLTDKSILDDDCINRIEKTLPRCDRKLCCCRSCDEEGCFVYDGPEKKCPADHNASCNIMKCGEEWA